MPRPSGPGVHLSTSLRTRALADTLAVATALMPRLAIAGCDDATPHDVLGVPVWFSFRPAGTTARIHAGKGVHPLEAQVGALMEAIEFAAAERADAHHALDGLSLAAVLRSFGPGLTIADLAPPLGVAMPPGRVVRVAACEDIATGAVHRLPAELLRLVPLAAGDDAPLFGTSSNGLASGNTLDEATLHGLLEVLERDCMALDHVKPSACRIAPGSLPQPFAGWCARWATLGTRLRVRQLANDVGIPCLEAELSASASAPAPAGRALGFGFHPDPLVALARAVTEAAQSRLYGLRYPVPCLPPAEPADIADLRDVAASEDRPCQEVAFSTVRGMRCDTVTGALAAVLARLHAAGLPWVLRRRLNQRADAADLDGLHVVKVVVPGCESAIGGVVRVGRRLALRLVQAA